MSILAALLLAATQAAAAAPASPAASTTQLDPARLAAAQRVVGQFFPADRRDLMVETMLTPSFNNIRESMLARFKPGGSFGNDPAFRAKLDSFMREEQGRALRLLRASMPRMMDAMARAYARRFTASQLDEIAAFFRTPTGRLYVTQSMTLMSDPDVQASQRAMMEESLKDAPQRIEQFARDAVAGVEPTP